MPESTLDKALFQQYAKLEADRRAIEETQKELKTILLQSITQEGVDRIAINEGTFSTFRQKQWKYSPEVEIAAKDLDNLMAEEKATGRASFKESISLKFYPKVGRDNH